MKVMCHRAKDTQDRFDTRLAGRQVPGEDRRGLPEPQTEGIYREFGHEFPVYRPTPRGGRAAPTGVGALASSDDRTLALPNYDDDGMYLSCGKADVMEVLAENDPARETPDST